MPGVPGVCTVSETIYDVRPEQYPSVIREMIRHEDDVTNHRIMWLLVGQGFLANAYISAKVGGASMYFMLSLVGALLSLSAFDMLYRSYRARGYLQFLGEQAKQGLLREEQLPLTGWPRSEINGWWKNSWACPWFRQSRDFLEPWVVLPYLFTAMWMMGLLHAATRLNVEVILILYVIASAVILSVDCIEFVWSQNKADEPAN
jgi:hypothetical protein